MSVSLDEWWIKDTSNDVIYANGDVGDYNHEDTVAEIILGQLAEIVGIEWDGGPDCTAFRVMMSDTVFENDPEYKDLDDPYEVILNKGIKAGVFKPQQALEARALINDHLDARGYAIKWWGWIRVAGTSLEMRDFSAAMLRKAGEGVETILDELGVDPEELDPETFELDISIFGKQGRRSVTLGGLLDGKTGEGQAEYDTINAAAAAAVKQMDQRSAHPYYKGHVGDSLRQVPRLLREVEQAAGVGVIANLRDIAMHPDTAGCDDYFAGMANGLEVAVAALTGEEPRFWSIEKQMRDAAK